MGDIVGAQYANMQKGIRAKVASIERLEKKIEEEKRVLKERQGKLLARAEKEKEQNQKAKEIFLSMKEPEPTLKENNVPKVQKEKDPSPTKEEEPIKDPSEGSNASGETATGSGHEHESANPKGQEVNAATTPSATEERRPANDSGSAEGEVNVKKRKADFVEPVMVIPPSDVLPKHAVVNENIMQRKRQKMQELLYEDYQEETNPFVNMFGF